MYSYDDDHQDIIIHHKIINLISQQNFDDPN